MLTKSAAALSGAICLQSLTVLERYANAGVSTSTDAIQEYVPDNFLAITIFCLLLDLEGWASGPEVWSPKSEIRE